jgi:hypothetical protein
MLGVRERSVQHRPSGRRPLAIKKISYVVRGGQVFPRQLGIPVVDSFFTPQRRNFLSNPLHQRTGAVGAPLVPPSQWAPLGIRLTASPTQIS